jgi:cob(I)alamin adenosyltransferase
MSGAAAGYGLNSKLTEGQPAARSRSADSTWQVVFIRSSLRSCHPTDSLDFPPMKIYTKTGDTGDTGLFGGGRVQKDDPRVEAYGDVDELNAVLGLARAVEPLPRIDEVLVPMQRDLFSIGALLATPDLEKMHNHLAKANIDDQRIKDLERAIDDCEKELEPLKAFIIPGGSRKGAVLHVARTVCRRAERRVVHLQREVEIPPLVVIYLNRMSDLLFMLARVANVLTGAGEVTW